jgi:hypothetical protein
VTTQPEGSNNNQRRGRLLLDCSEELSKTIRRLILEGVIDPQQGTSFAVVQHRWVGNLFEELDDIAEAVNVVVDIGFPDPVEFEFRQLTGSLESEGEQADGEL